MIDDSDERGARFSSAAEDDRLRSLYMKALVRERPPQSDLYAHPRLPRSILQFWDDLDTMPADVRECIDSWRPLEERGFTRLVFDDQQAARFIGQTYGAPHVAAFKRCRHPAMRSDYFRLCYIAIKGGFYVDADEYYQGGECEPYFLDDRLKVQPLCYDNATGSMIPAATFLSNGRVPPDWTFYVNNNPLIAPPFHPVIRLALARSTRLLLRQVPRACDIQSTTGPGNLTASLVQHAMSSEAGAGRDFSIVPNWDAVSISKWPLSYRSDERNWRLWIQMQLTDRTIPN